MRAISPPASSLPLLVLGVLADDPDRARATNHLALVADPLHRGPNLHLTLRCTAAQTRRAKIRPRPGSVVDDSTRTRSPGRSRTLARRARPAAWATTFPPPSNSTRKSEFGKGSRTRPRRPPGSFMVAGTRKPSELRPRQSIADLAGGWRRSDRLGKSGQNLDAVLADRHRVFEVAGSPLVSGDHGPAVWLDQGARVALVDDRLDRQAEAGADLDPLARRSMIRDLGRLVHV